MRRQYLCIDLKSFYASVECVERGLDSMTTRLVVADPERTDKTICLAVSPALKAMGVKNRCRVFEIPPDIEYITAPPRMKKYIDYAAEIYAIYLKYVSKDDMHVYSIDEVFMDVTYYLPLYKISARALARRITEDVYRSLGIRATCGIGTNLYLAKIALDITAKHSPDFIGELDEQGFCRTMWDHRPLTDFWRIGKGLSASLEQQCIYTMGDIAHAPQEALYRRYGVDAELIIDHAWGREPTTIADIKAYHSKTNCLTSGQVLMRDYSFLEGEIIIKEMTEALCMEMLEKGVVTDSVTLYVGYSNALKLPPARGSARLASASCSTGLLIPAMTALYGRIVDRSLPVRRINISFNRVSEDNGVEQMSIFEDSNQLERERELQKTVISLKKRFGKNSVLRAMSLQQAATAMERNRQIGGHKSGEQ